MSGVMGLPFERGTTMSGAGTNWLGDEFWDSQYKQRVRIVKNTDAAALAAKRLVKWEDASAFGVDYTTAQANGVQAAGVVDPVLTGTVAVNEIFFVVTAGIVTCAVGSESIVTAVGSPMVPSVDGDKGKIITIPAIAAPMSAEILAGRQVVAVAQAVISASNNVEVLLNIQAS